MHILSTFPGQIFRSVIACFAVACTLTSASTLAQGLVAERERFFHDFPAHQIAERSWVIQGPSGLPGPDNYGFMSNPGFVLTSEGFVVIDPGSSHAIGELVLKRLREISDLPVVAIFNSHVHGDHWLGNGAIVEAFPGIPIYGSQAFIDQVDSGAGENWIALLKTMTSDRIGPLDVVGPNVAVTDGEILTIGDSRFEILRSEKAHTATDIVIGVQPHGVVFLGDNTFNGRIGRLDDGSLTGIMDILDRAIALEQTLYVPGHGRWGGESVPAAYRALIAGIYSGVEAGYEEGLADFEMKDAIVEQLTPRFGHLQGFADDIGRAISIAFLEVEDNAF